MMHGVCMLYDTLRIIHCCIPSHLFEDVHGLRKHGVLPP
jgi:hypothetical protein